jgi:hypothetical protein
MASLAAYEDDSRVPARDAAVHYKARPATAKTIPTSGSHMICMCDQIVRKGHKMLDVGPFPTIWVSQETVAPWPAVAIYAFIAGLPALLAWLLDAPRS